MYVHIYFSLTLSCTFMSNFSILPLACRVSLLYVERGSRTFGIRPVYLWIYMHILWYVNVCLPTYKCDFVWEYNVTKVEKDRRWILLLNVCKRARDKVAMGGMCCWIISTGVVVVLLVGVIKMGLASGDC